MVRVRFELDSITGEKIDSEAQSICEMIDDREFARKYAALIEPLSEL